MTAASRRRCTVTAAETCWYRTREAIQVWYQVCSDNQHRRQCELGEKCMTVLSDGQVVDLPAMDSDYDARADAAHSRAKGAKGRQLTEKDKEARDLKRKVQPPHLSFCVHLKRHD